MNMIQAVPVSIVPVISSYMDWETFTLFFAEWMEDKDNETILTALENTDLFRFFPTGHFSPMFVQWMEFASDLGVLESMCYGPLKLLLEGNPDDFMAAEWDLHDLYEEGHKLSEVFLHVFTLITNHLETDRAVADLIPSLEYPSVVYNINGWFRTMKTWRNNLPEAREFNFRRDVAPICDQWKEDPKNHFNESSWPATVTDIFGVPCKLCRVKILMYDFCKSD